MFLRAALCQDVEPVKRMIKMNLDKCLFLPDFSIAMAFISTLNINTLRPSRIRIRVILFPIWSYLAAGYLLHLMTLGEAGLLVIILGFLTEGFTESLFEKEVWKIIFYFALWLYPVSAQFDARSRFQNYKQIKDQIYLFGFRTRILKPVLKSRCQRDAARQAAFELGYGDRCRLYFRKHGYRWYHLLPDFVFTHPFFFFSRYFWKTTFFAPTYRPRVDYRNIPMDMEMDYA